MFATFANAPSADRRPWSVVRAERGLDAVEEAVANAKLRVEQAIDALVVVLDSYGSIGEAERRHLIAVASEAIDDLAAPVARNLEAQL